MGYYNEAKVILKYINMLKVARCKPDPSNLPMSDNQLLSIASATVLASKHFPQQMSGKPSHMPRKCGQHKRPTMQTTNACGKEKNKQ